MAARNTRSCFSLRKRFSRTNQVQPTTACQKVFGITELLEEILLQTDLRTLLTSAQRVSKRWYSLIQDSSKLQIALFFEPSFKKFQPGDERIKNPFIEESIWNGFFRKNLSSTPENAIEGFDLMDPQKETAYLRENASWKRMLLTQPPSTIVGVIETETFRFNGPIFTQVILDRTLHGWCSIPQHRQLGELYDGISQGVLVPGEDPLVFWSKHQFLKYKESEMKFNRWDAVPAKFTKDCDVLFIVGKCNNLAVAWISADPWKIFEEWLESLGGSFVVPVKTCHWQLLY